ncbi:MAG: LysR family transcriptional regulator [Ruminococcus sp.]|nr:LysR family transcriptional regulator [Ruminococcus sp.]
MEILQLKYFCAVAENLHVTKTAEQLHVAQPALTQSIRRLEQELDVPLFRKKGRNIILTEYGAYLNRRLIPILQKLDALPEKLQEMAQIRKKTLRINVLAASTIVTEALITYQKRHDNIRFQVVQNTEDTDADITVFTTEQFAIPEQSQDAFHIFTEHIFLAVPNVPEFQGKASIRLCELRDTEFISLAGSRALRVICDRFCMQTGFSPRIIFESDSPDAVKNLIAAGLGVGFWPHYTWGRHDMKEILLLPLKDPSCKRDIVVQLHAQSAAQQKDTEEFFEFLGDYFQQLRSSAHKKQTESKKTRDK